LGIERHARTVPFAVEMRVIAGSAKGRKLASPSGRGTRPTSDKVREAMFGMLGSLDVIDGARVVDLFAGSGALGIEALSRGAAHATFVERERDAINVIERNLATTGFGDQAVIVRGDAAAFDGSVDVAFADPPYDFDGWPALLDALHADVAIVESDRDIDVGAKWLVSRVRRYGSTVVTLAQRKGGM
jgi:16S rRNA (guanine966-N2)-methyltransferase